MAKRSMRNILNNADNNLSRVINYLQDLQENGCDGYFTLDDLIYDLSIDKDSLMAIARCLDREGVIDDYVEVE